MQRVLELWGAWARQDSLGTDYSSIAAGFRGLVSYQKGRDTCCDNDGLAIDRCIAKLNHYSPYERDLIVLHYVYNVSTRKLARKHRCCDATIRRQLKSAAGFINGLMCGMDITLQCDV